MAEHDVANLHSRFFMKPWSQHGFGLVIRSLACVCIVCRSLLPSLPFPSEHCLPLCLRIARTTVGPSPAAMLSFPLLSSLALLSLKDGLDLKTRLKRLRDHLAAFAAAAAAYDY